MILGAVMVLTVGRSIPGGGFLAFTSVLVEVAVLIGLGTLISHVAGIDYSLRRLADSGNATEPGRDD
jgi:hypothetical protein